MHYELGQFSRGRYSTFLPREYDPDWFKAQTTDVDRTHMSCQSNLAGMFRPTENETWKEDLPWQPIPVHPVDSEILSAIPPCSIYQTEYAKVLASDPLYVALNEEFADLFTYLTNYTGTNVTSVVKVNSIYDTLHIENQLGFELPKWTEAVYPEPMRTITAYVFQASSFTVEMKRLGKYARYEKKK